MLPLAHVNAESPPIYVLSHFHADHYQGLHVDWAKQAVAGARIHCSTVTSKLLEGVFNLPRDVVKGHAYL